MSRAAPTHDLPPLPWRQRLWPIAPALLVAAAVAGLLTDTYDVSVGTMLLVAVLPIGLAIIATGVVLGGRRGWYVALALTALAAYWAWWFGWGLDANISPFSVDQAAVGLSDAAIYEVALFVSLWPFVLVAAAAVGVVARRRGRRVWSSLGVLALALLVLSFPVGGTWTDTCNDTTGATPLVTRPAAQQLMDRGVGVIPGGFQTLALCEGVGDRAWKPFWLGGDGLPPKPHLNTWQGGTVAAGIQIPERLDGSPASGSAADGARRR